MTQQVCAYCKAASPPTREHLWPASLHRRLVAANRQESNSFWLARLRKSIPSEPQIRDVCAQCNNVVLSALDSYICGLFDSTFVHIPLREERVQFEHNYHQLKRWLLKMCFNSARIHNSPDLLALDTLLPYILGKNDALGQSTQLFLQLSYPQQVPTEDVAPEYRSDRPAIFYPSMNRVGHMHYTAHGVGKKLLRAVHLRSFSFFLAFWKPGNGKAEQDDFTSFFTRHLAGTILLRPGQSTVDLLCNGVGAWDSFKKSRAETKYEFDADA